MRDRVVEYPGRYKMTDTVSGDQYTFDVVRDEGNVAIDGTPYDTEHVLSNSTATSMGLNLDATPNDAFAKLQSDKQPKTLSQEIAGESTVEGCLGALQPQELSQAIAGETTVEGAIGALNSKFGGIKLVYLTKTVTVPANSSLELNLTSDVGNHSIMVLSATLGLYQLPYVVNGAAKTWIYRAYNQTIIIQNNESSWDNYTLNLVLAVLL